MSVTVLVVAQGGLAQELVAAAEAISGQRARLQYLDIPWQSRPDEIRELLRAEIARLDRGGGVLVLTPLAGDALFQQAAQLQPTVEVLGGVNLGMLLALSCSDLCETPLPQLVRELQVRGRRAIRTTEPDAGTGAR